MKIMRNITLAAVAAVLLVGGAFATPAEAASIGVTPALQTVALGSLATVSVDLALAAGESTGGYALRLTWNPALLSLNGGVANLGPFGAGAIFNNTPGAGFVDIDVTSVVAVLPAQGAGFNLLSVNFNTLAVGTSAINIVDQFGGLVSNADGTALLPTTVSNACITVAPVGANLPPPQDCRQNPVPEPASIALLGTGLGLGALAAFRRRRAQANG